MKLRIKGNSIRLRLLRSEIERLSAQGEISDEVHFGDTALRYSLRMSREAESVNANFDRGEITVVIPEDMGRTWAEGDGVGLDAEQPIGEGGPLAILVEKDFACLDRPDDPDRDDAYPNPHLACAESDED